METSLRTILVLMNKQKGTHLIILALSVYYMIYLRLLTETVNVVFHCAATVRFDEDLTKSVAMNVAAVLAIVNLAKKMGNLEVRNKRRYAEFVRYF